MCHTIPAGRGFGRAVRHEPAPSLTPPPAGRTRLLRQAAVATALMLALATPSTMAYADMAGPGRPLWAARLQLESARLALETDPSDDAALHLEFAARRLSDLAVLLTRDADPQVVERVAANLEHNLHGLAAAMEPRGEQAPPAPVEADLQQRLLERVVVVGELARSGCAAEQIGQEGCANLQQAVEHSEVILADVGEGTQVAGNNGSSNAKTRRPDRGDGDTEVSGEAVEPEPAANVSEGDVPPDELAAPPSEESGLGPAEAPSDGATEPTESPGEPGEPGTPGETGTPGEPGEPGDGAGAIGDVGDTGPIADVPPDPSPSERSSPDPDPDAGELVAPPRLEPIDPEPAVSPGELPASPVPSASGPSDPGSAAPSPTPPPSGGPDPSVAATPTPAEPTPTTEPFPVVPWLEPIPQDPTDPPITLPSPRETRPSETPPSDRGPGTTPDEPTPTDPTPGDPTPAEPAPGDRKPSDRKPSDPKPGDPKPGDPQPGDPKPDDPAPDAPPPTDIRSPEPKPEPEPSNRPPPRSEGRPKDEPAPQAPPPSEEGRARLGKVAGGHPHE